MIDQPLASKATPASSSVRPAVPRLFSPAPQPPSLERITLLRTAVDISPLDGWGNTLFLTTVLLPQPHYYTSVFYTHYSTFTLEFGAVRSKVCVLAWIELGFG
ncbi:hypothetical protein ACLB2K_049498 [Fragaria x ananassa]